MKCKKCDYSYSAFFGDTWNLVQIAKALNVDQAELTQGEREYVMHRDKIVLRCGCGLKSEDLSTGELF